MADIFNEIDEELKQEKTLVWFKKYGPYLLGLAILIVLVVAGNEIYQGYRHNTSLEAADKISLALTEGDKAQQLASLEELVPSLPEGYQAYVLMQAVGKTDATEKQAELLAQIYNDSTQDQSLREAARIKWGFLQYKTASVDSVKVVLAPLAESTSQWRFLAREIQAYAYLAHSQTEDAKNALKALVDEIDTPESIRARARSLLANFS